MSSPATRRTRASNKSSASSRSSREPPSSPTMRESTPRAARALAAERNIPSSSPAAYQSSPMRQQTAETPDVRMGDASSQFDDGDRTPRANQGVRGMSDGKFFHHICSSAPIQTLTLKQTLLLSVILQVPVLRVVSVDPISAPTSAPMPSAPAVGYSSPLVAAAEALVAVTFTLVGSTRPLLAGIASSWAPMACLRATMPRAPMRLSPTSTLAPPRLRPWRVIRLV